MRIKRAPFLYGIIIISTVLSWNAYQVQSVFLTSTLITGMMGGYLIGRMPLGTFLEALTNNASLPSLPSVTSFLPSFPTFSPRQEGDKTSESTVKPVVSTTTAAPTTTTTTTTRVPNPVYPIYPSYVHPFFQPTAPPAPTPNYNFPFPYSVAGNGIYTYNMFTTTTTTAKPPLSTSSDNFGFSYIKPVDVPVSLDNKIRERFIRQLATIDPLNCLPKTFCEVTSDPYRATMALDRGSILGMASIHQPTITREELMAYESQLPTSRPPPRPTAPPLPPSTTTTAPSKANEEEEDEEEDDKSHSGSDEEEEQPEDDTDSGSHSEENSDEEDDSFERYRKEHEHKLEMQALDEMIDEIEDPETYMYILRDKQKRKDARKRYKQKHEGGGGDDFHESRERIEPGLRRDGLVDEEMHPGFYENEEPTMALTRRAGSEPEYHQYYPPPIPMPPPPLLPPPSPPAPERPSFFSRWTTTEAPIKDMFADDPFFADVAGRNAKKLRDRIKDALTRRRRNKRDLVGDPLTQYRLAYIVAEKYKNPNLCNTAFPSCPYQTQTIMSVVNRLQSGILPLDKSQNSRYREKSNRNNLDQFRNTLVAIERLNKATMNARARGEPIDIEEITEVASSPSSNIEAKTSQDIVNEFQRVVAKIQTAQFANRRLQLEKSKPLNGDQPKTSYDAVHYYKKAQMEDLKPKERLKTGILTTKSTVKQQDDEAPHKREVPTFKETYREMFRKAVKKSQRKASTKTNKYVNTPKQKVVANQKSDRKKRKPESDKKMVQTTPVEDDERDAKDEEMAVDAMITRRRQRSRYA